MVKKKSVAKKAAKKTKVVTRAATPSATAKNAVAKKAVARKASAKSAALSAAFAEVDRDDAPPVGKRGTKVVGVSVAKKALRGGKEDAPSGIGEGDRAPSFVLKDQDGNLISSESLRGAPYLIYFYPKNDTPGCTLEACSFRDSAPRFSAKGVRVLGVSPDSPESHARFRKKYGLNYSLLSDPEKTLAKAYGVWVKKLNYGREYMGVERSTFFVDRSGTVRKAWRRVRVPGHVDEVVHTV